MNAWGPCTLRRLPRKDTGSVCANRRTFPFPTDDDSDLEGLCEFAFCRSFTTALITLFLAVGLATSAISQARTPDASGAEPPFAHSRDGIRELYIIAFGLFGPESVFASEATKAGEILRARLPADAQLLVRFNDKRGGSATSASLAAALRSAGQAMDPNQGHFSGFLDLPRRARMALMLLQVVARETLSPRALRAMLNASGARYRVIIISACYSGVFARALADPRTLVITAAAPDRPSFGCEDGATWTYFGDAFFNQALRGSRTLDEAFCRARESSPSGNGTKASNLPDRRSLAVLRSCRCSRVRNQTG